MLYCAVLHGYSLMHSIPTRGQRHSSDNAENMSTVGVFRCMNAFALCWCRFGGEIVKAIHLQLPKQSWLFKSCACRDEGASWGMLFQRKSWSMLPAHLWLPINPSAERDHSFGWNVAQRAEWTNCKNHTSLKPINYMFISLKEI